MHPTALANKVAVRKNILCAVQGNFIPLKSKKEHNNNCFLCFALKIEAIVYFSTGVCVKVSDLLSEYYFMTLTIATD